MSPPRSRPMSSAPPAAVLILVVLALLVAGCGSDAPSPADSASAAVDALAGVNWAEHIRDCSVEHGGSGLGTVIDDVVKADLTGDGRVETLVVNQCDSSTSPWPQQIEVFDGASDPANPARLGVLLEGDGEYPRDVSVTAEPGGRVVIIGKGLSSTAPLCCPDLTLRRVYRYDGRSFALVESMSRPAVSSS
jgi:hypothetical protein